MLPSGWRHAESEGILLTCLRLQRFDLVELFRPQSTKSGRVQVVELVKGSPEMVEVV
jgi:dTDP-4-dehydrorhamnose 3,5-epimerase-like enzyme